MTPEQEAILIELANKLIEERQEAQARNEKIDLDQRIEEARQAKLAELKAQAQAVIDNGLQEFETKEVPRIR